MDKKRLCKNRTRIETNTTAKRFRERIATFNSQMGDEANFLHGPAAANKKQKYCSREDSKAR